MRTEFKYMPYAYSNIDLCTKFDLCTLTLLDIDNAANICLIEILYLSMLRLTFDFFGVPSVLLVIPGSLEVSVPETTKYSK